MTRIQRSLPLILLLALFLLGGCGDAFRDRLLLDNKETPSDQTSSSEDTASGPETYTTSYRNLSFTLPEGWNVTHDQVSHVTISSEGGSSIEIAFSESAARVALLTFPASEKEAAKALDLDGHLAGTYTMLEQEYLVYSKDTEKEMNFYHYLIQGIDGGYRLYAGIRTDRQAYQITVSTQPGADAELQTATELLNTLDFLDNEQMTASFLSGMSSEPPDPDLVDSAEDADAVTVTCISPVNVRTAPSSKNSQVIGSLNTGDVIKVTGEEGGWYQFEFEGRTAYAYKKYFQ